MFRIVVIWLITFTTMCMKSGRWVGERGRVVGTEKDQNGTNPHQRDGRE